MRAGRLCVLAVWLGTAVVTVACGDDDGNGAGADADPNAPDADPNAPDAATSCTGELTLCSGACVDTSTNETHCGGCGDSCTGGTTCVGGDCVSGVNGLVLAEVHAQPPSYFELFNGSDAAIDLTGYQLQWDGNGTNGSRVLPGFTIEPGAFVPVYEGFGELETAIYIGDDVDWAGSIAVILREPGGLGVDFVRTGGSVVSPPTGTAWSGDNAANPNENTDQSLVRNVYRPDTDTAADWSLTPLPSPGSFCARPGRCGDACLDLATDRGNCGACGSGCGAQQICVDGGCANAFGDVWISEYRRYPRGGVELHNPTAGAVDLSGYQLNISDGPSTLSYTFDGWVLAAGSRVWLSMGSGIDDTTTIHVGSTSAFAADVAVALFDPTLTPVDFVRFGQATEPAPAGTYWFGDNVPAPRFDADESARRNVETFDTDGPADWVTDMPTTPGFACFPDESMCGGRCVALAVDSAHCGACGLACGPHERCADGLCQAPGHVVISEIAVSGTEAFELFNGTGEAVDISGWKLDIVADVSGTHLFTVPEGVVLEPGAFVFVLDSGGTDTASRLYTGTNDIEWTEHGSVALRTATDTGVDFVRTGASVTMPPAGTAWTGAADNPTGTTGTEVLRRTIYAPDTDSPADWVIVATNITEGSYCPSGFTTCDGECVRIDRDSANCGACGNTCPVGAACADSACVADGALRLVPYSGADNGVTRGRVDAFLNGRWMGINYTTAGEAGADVACRQLGFASGTHLGYAHYVDFGTINMNCTGAEARVSDCPWQSVGNANGLYLDCTP